jgi:hypothetical protein
MSGLRDPSLNVYLLQPAAGDTAKHVACLLLSQSRVRVDLKSLTCFYTELNEFVVVELGNGVGKKILQRIIVKYIPVLKFGSEYYIKKK